MSNNLKKIISNNNIVSNRKTNSKNTNNISEGRKKSKQKSKISELIIYMKKKEYNGISLYSHIRALIDVFIFQNPTEPIKYFEYYSQQLKDRYHQPLVDPDLDFLNNIDINVCNKIINIFKEIRNKNRDNQILENKISNQFYGEDIEYDGENEYVETIKSTIDLNEVIIQDLSKVNYMFNKAGCGITNEEAYFIGITINQMSYLGKFKNIRYWGKILGLKHNYYIIECEWKNEELESKLKLLNKIINYSNNGILNENNDIYEYETEINSLLNKDNLFVETNEQIEEEGYFLKTQCSVPLLKNDSDLEDYLSYEMFGFGTNKKSYFVTNQLSNEWTELPLLKPRHIIQSRNISRYFVGDLESPVKSYPIFQGLEKHYLRAQIARITATTQISPKDYFVLDSSINTKSKRWTNLNPFQLKVMSQKWVHDYTQNKNYNPPPVYDLLKPINWVHHIPLISKEGVTMAWTRLLDTEDNESKNNFISEENISYNFHVVERNVSNDKLNEYDVDDSPDIFIAISDDDYIDCIPPWKFELTNPFDHKATYVTSRSNVWPGAFTVARENLLDYTYYGWGLKFNVNGSLISAMLFNEFQYECPNDTKDITEINDPTHAEETLHFENFKQMKKDRKKRKANPIKSFNNYDNENAEEKTLMQHNYN